MLASSVPRRYRGRKRRKEIQGAGQHRSAMWGGLAVSQDFGTHEPDLYDPTDDALRACDESLQQHERDEAWKRLIPVIEEIAGHVARTYGMSRIVKVSGPRAGEPVERHGTSELEQEAVSHVFGKLSTFRAQDGQKPNFRAWCRVILKHLAVDILRRGKKERPVVFGDPKTEATPATVDEPPAPPPEANEETEERLRRASRLREVLDLLSSRMPPPSDGRVDYFAVLLLRLRLNVARVAVHSGKKDDLDLVAEWLIPWHEHERERRFKDGYPSLAAVWDALAREFAAAPPPWEAGRLCEIINGLGPRTPLSNDMWNQWTNRGINAVKKAAEGLAEEDLTVVIRLM